jgi:hypothetical protein
MSTAARPAKNFMALGVIVSSAPRLALLAALQQLRPQLDIQLLEIAPVIGTGQTGYRVEVDVSEKKIEANNSIDLWLQIKSAVMAKFPADKPDAVTAIDP